MIGITALERILWFTFYNFRHKARLGVFSLVYFIETSLMLSTVISKHNGYIQEFYLFQSEPTFTFSHNMAW